MMIENNKVCPRFFQFICHRFLLGLFTVIKNYNVVLCMLLLNHNSRLLLFTINRHKICLKFINARRSRGKKIEYVVSNNNQALLNNIIITDSHRRC